MKKISKIMLFLFLSVFTFEGCSNLLDVDSSRLVFPNGYQLTGANDTLYSTFAIFSQLEKLADSYVLLGELRGDLMDVTSNSNLYLKEINNFNISSSNPFANNIKDYYSVINNCNYVIHNIDTSIVRGGVKVMCKEYAACKAIRAWTYMQIALNYGSAIYYDKPILTVEDAQAVQKQTPLSLTDLAPILISDINPWKDVDVPTLGTLYSQNTSNCYFPIRFLLGDLYLWTGQYENAANEYKDLMYKNSYVINTNNNYSRKVTNNAFTGEIDLTTSSSGGGLSVLSSEDITDIAASNEYGTVFKLDSLTLNHMIAPSALSITNWQKQPYFVSNTLDTLGDLRLIEAALPLSISLSTFANISFASLYNRISPTGANYVYKFILMNPISTTKSTSKRIMPYRVPLLYLRYAEAVNRIGKPNLAMAVLKNGLTRANLNNKKIVPQNELGSSLPNYMNFTDTRFDTNIGIRMRGCGKVNQDTTYYVIGPHASLQDSVLHVEDLIQQELALETAFQGNRFQDLMRISLRRNDPSYLANLVSAKYTDNKDAIKNKLLNTANWYLTK